MRVAFITNICPHYRVKTFETIANQVPVDFYFFSAGDEWYWQRQHGVQTGDFQYEYLPGVRVGKTRITPSLPLKLLFRNYDVYIKCINGKFALPITYLVARLKRRPFILWTGIWMRLNTPVHKLLYPLTKYIYQHADAIVVYGEHVKEFLVGEGVDPNRIFIAAHAVDNDQYSGKISPEELSDVRKRLSLSENDKIILYLGRLEAGKGLEYLIQAFIHVPDQDVKLVIAGTGTLEEYYRQIVDESGISSRVRFAGYIPIDQTVSLYALAEVFVVPSITTDTFKEPWGLVVNEAFNQGTPIIATDAVGAAAGGLIEHEKTGLIVPEKNSTLLSEAINILVSDEQYAMQLGENARQKISSWDNENMVMGFMQAIRKVTHE